MRIATIGLLGGVLAAAFGAVSPASAEFFNCHQRPGQLLYSYNGAPSQYGSRTTSSSRYTHDFAAQSSRPRYSQSRVTYSSSRQLWNDRSRW